MFGIGIGDRFRNKQEKGTKIGLVARDLDNMHEILCSNLIATDVLKKKTRKCGFKHKI